ncbi:Uncharacterized protein D0Z07_9032 [Hyphodiscus hymeniophilus]|uniref:Uncharacterized protein n=1 Tax=Hyphodiscus hymeniophilus TaxID=353542 RepID=A0A9P6SJS4_9HELO|nr:Uncharacterized protein D0Z07_9032 [Hyphodiscus hymeniophilus]
MTEKDTIVEFQFVNSTVDTPSVPQDLAIRALIRKQAMKKASAARKKDGNYGKHNLRQYPVFLFDDNNNLDGGVAAKVSGQGKDFRCDDQKPGRIIGLNGQKELRRSKKIDPDEKIISTAKWLARHTRIPGSLPARGYELTSIKSEFDILDLSNLATAHINRAGRAALSQNPYHLIHQLQSSKQQSYLSFLPSRYGQIPCLSDATDCVIARARQLISPEKNWEAAVIAFYRYQPEVLCATEILALYESAQPLNPIKEQKLTYWQMTEALITGQRCFLEQPAWQTVLRSVIMPDAPLLSDRGSTVVELMVLKCNIPGLFLDVTNMICHQSDPDASFIIEMACKIHQLRVDLVKWHAEFGSIVRSNPAVYTPGTAEFDRRCQVFATYISCMIISSRLLGAISPTERSELEEETQVLTGQMLNLEIEVKKASLQTYLFLAQTLGVSHATINTSELWRDSKEKETKVEDENGDIQPDTPDSPGPRGLIDAWKFQRWNQLMGRTIS